MRLRFAKGSALLFLAAFVIVSFGFAFQTGLFNQQDGRLGSSISSGAPANTAGPQGGFTASGAPANTAGPQPDVAPAHGLSPDPADAATKFADIEQAARDD